MSNDNSGGIGGFLNRLRGKAADAVAHQEAAFARGNVAGVTVRDGAGNVIVDAGHVIDDAAIAAAEAAGCLHALASSAATGQAQDMRERAARYVAKTPEGKEASAVGSVEDFVEARTYVGRIAGLDVTDIRGSVLVPAGKEISEADVRLVREAGQLPALIYSAQQPAPAVTEPAPAAPVPPAAPAAPEPPPAPRRTLPVLPVQPPDRERP